MWFFRKIYSLLIFLLLISIITTSSTQAAESKVGWLGIAVGNLHSVAVKQDGTVWSWGERVKVPTQVKGISDVISVAAGLNYSIALKKDGTVWKWQYDSPAQVKGLSHITSISAFEGSSFAFQDNGTLWTWGEVRTVNGIPTPILDPIPLESFSGAVAATNTNDGYLVLKKDGTLWGPVGQLFGLNNIKQFSACNGSVYVLKYDGTVMAWGRNSVGELGDGTYINRKSPVTIEGVKDVEALSANMGGVLYLKKDGTLWTNGFNSGGQLGIGSYEDKTVPVQIKGMSKIKTIPNSMMGSRVMAIRQDNTLWSWGNGYVGDGTRWYRTVPVMIKSYESQVLQDIDTIRVDVNGHELEFDQPPIQIQDRTMVPLRKIFESLGAAITWDQETATAIATKGATTVKLSVGNDVAFSNGQAITLDAPPVVVNDRIVVPVRFIGEAFGAKVNWDESINTAEISY